MLQLTPGGKLPVGEAIGEDLPLGLLGVQKQCADRTWESGADYCGLVGYKGLVPPDGSVGGCYGTFRGGA